MEFWQILGDLHPRLVQFPLVLLLTSLVFDAIGLIRGGERFHWAAKILSGIGTFFLLFAFICGIYAEIWAGRAGIPQEQIEWHELMANVSSWGFVILAAWRLLLSPANRKSLTVYTLLGLSWYLLLAATAYLGGRLVFDYGTAVIGARANNVLSLHDLNVLATRQTDENIRYSELMHHIFGWLTLALSGSLFAQALFPKRGDKLKWVGPALLLLGGVFLFFFADRDLYPNFLDPRQLRDREVQLHKALATILAVVGAVGLMNLKKHSKKAAAEDSEADTSGRLSTPSKVVAVMAIIGGGMLFTHVHTVAPYANVAAGVYVAHVVMGLTALGIGAARLLQDGVPRFRHAFAIIFAVLMCGESVMLITYNEGLPWYIGYGQYTRTGPHHGTIAPYGRLRAELTFDTASNQFDVYILDRFRQDLPVEIAAKPIQLLISRGYQETAIQLDPTGSNPTSDHFTAAAPSLQGIPAFSARLALPVNDAMKMGYFDPWVIPILMDHAIPPNATPRYECPMHEAMQSETPANCPLCGMAMVPIQRTLRTTLHDPGFEMDFSNTSDPTNPDPLHRTFIFTPRHSGAINALAIVHEHPLHLIIVSQDLSFYDHIHPIVQPNGCLQISYAFPKPGNYILFADTTPVGERNQVFRFPISIGQPAPAEEPAPPVLIPTAAGAKPLEHDPSITSTLIFQPRVPTAGLHTHFILRLADEGKPIIDLQPIMGAMGHCVIISQDTQTYIHCHPEQLFNPRGNDRGGPDINFHTIFPSPGKYKMWIQTQRDGKILLADFTIEIQSPLLPPKVINFLLDD